jgi:hypothetical protein
MIVRTIGRLILVPLAFVLAACAAMAVLVTLGQERVVHALNDATALDEAILGLGGVVFKLGLALFSVQTLLLPLLLVIGGEVARIRHAAYYVAGGGIVFAMIPLMANLGRSGSVGGAGGIDSSAAVWPIFATAGFAAGLVYWLVAGRRA